MGKKRKASAQVPFTEVLRDSSLSNSKLRVSTFEDVADSEDEFHINQDKILLEEIPLHKRQRKAREEGKSNRIRSLALTTLITCKTNFSNFLMKRSFPRHPALTSLRILKKLRKRTSQIAKHQLDQRLTETMTRSRTPPNYLQTTTRLAVGGLLRTTTTMPTLSKLKPMPARKRLKSNGCSRNIYRE